MIKSIELLEVRWITTNIEFNKLNFIEGRNWSWKSTIIDLIKWMYKWKINIKSWISILTDTDWLVLRNEVWILTNKWFALWTDIELCTAWFFMWWTQISWINKSQEDKRKTISELLWIDRDQFFKDKWIDYDIKWLTWELKELKIREDTYTDSLIKTENDLDWLEVVTEPIEIKYNETVEWNQSELDRLKDNLKSIRLIDTKQWLLKEPKEVLLIQGNQNELDQLNKELQNIWIEGKNIPAKCDKCNQDIVNAEDIKKSLRIKYTKKLEEISIFKLEKSNQLDYEIYQREYALYDSAVIQYKKDIEDNKNIQINVDDINKKIKEFKLIKTTLWNIEEFAKYKDELSLYKVYESSKKQLEENIEWFINDIKWLDWKTLEKKIKKYKLIEKEFVSSVGNQLQLWDLQIIFYKELKSPNTKWEMFTETFDIKYKGKLYNEISGWERAVIDILIAKLFIDKNDIIDFMLQDNAEISKEVLTSVYTDVLEKDKIQLIATRISNTELIITNK